MPANRGVSENAQVSLQTSSEVSRSTSYYQHNDNYDIIDTSKKIESEDLHEHMLKIKENFRLKMKLSESGEDRSFRSSMVSAQNYGEMSD